MANILEGYGMRGVQETVTIIGEAPDLVVRLNDYKFVIEVKIDSEAKLLEDIPRAHRKALAINAHGAISMLFPSRVREIHPDLLDKTAPSLEITTAILLLPWASDKWEHITLNEFAKKIWESYETFRVVRYPVINYDLIVNAARAAVNEIAATMRRRISLPEYLQDALSVVGRFDLYSAMLKDLKVTDKELKTWIADIAAYLFVNQLLFYHILSQKNTEYTPIPDVNPLNPSANLLDVLRQSFSNAAQRYEHILGPDIIPILERTGGQNVIWTVARYVDALKALRPEHIKEELLGRLYQESIPPEARKNLGAFFTKPTAATLLSTLAIDNWDDKVLDPACGSGTLLVEAYRRKTSLAPADMDRIELHTKFLHDIYGIDVMHFAHNMASINLTTQNILAPVRPHINADDGIEPMMTCVEGDDPPLITLEEYFDKVKAEKLQCRSFDVVIMNPPFTRRERLPARELSRLDRILGKVVRGKTGYWAYFVAAADNMIKNGGKLAIVMPEEFFSGGSAESLRRFLFFGESYERDKYVKNLDRLYSIRYVVRSSMEVAFSEGALYRDYLIVFDKSTEHKPMVFAVLKKRLEDLSDKLADIAERLREFSNSRRKSITTREFDGIRIQQPEKIINKHISNLAPLVGLSSVEAQKIILELLDSIGDLPTLGEMEDSELISIRAYNPGQHTTKGVEDEARHLFAARYESRAQKISFEVLKTTRKQAKLKATEPGSIFLLNRTDYVPSLRTYSGVKHLNLTHQEELAIVNPRSVPKQIRDLVGLVNPENLNRASKDIRSAYNDLAGEIVLARRIQLPSPGLHWLAWFTSNKAIGTTSALLNMRIKEGDIGKLMVLYLNSTIALLQLLAFKVETRGAWITLHGDQVWSHLHTPSFYEMSDSTKKKALEIFDEVGKASVMPIDARIERRDRLQRKIDKLALEMLGLDEWKPRLEEIYQAISEELALLLRILEQSKKAPKKTKRSRKVKDEDRGQTTFDMFES